MATANPRLISRKIVEETFALDDDLAHSRDNNDLDEADDDDEDDDVDQKPRRR